MTLAALLLPASGWAQDKEGRGPQSERVDQIGISLPDAKVKPKASLPDIEDEVMCTACGTLLALATESPVANRERDLIRDLIAQGMTKDQIKDRLVVEFGPNVLATPSTDGFDLTAWIVPGLAVVVAAIAIFVGLRRWRRETEERDDGTPGPSALSDEDAKRLDSDLGKYQL
ncbi:hypothetical protein BH10ACT11_BH10ACT11_14200 [soil metagenome]